MSPVAQSPFLTPQLENRLGGEERFQERVTGHLVPCISQFSVAMADDSLWKPLNYQILLKTRDSSPKVRCRGGSAGAPCSRHVAQTAVVRSRLCNHGN